MAFIPMPTYLIFFRTFESFQPWITSVIVHGSIFQTTHAKEMLSQLLYWHVLCKNVTLFYPRHSISIELVVANAESHFAHWIQMIYNGSTNADLQMSLQSERGLRLHCCCAVAGSTVLPQSATSLGHSEDSSTTHLSQPMSTGSIVTNGSNSNMGMQYLSTNRSFYKA